jgi:hypothetical protein
MNRSTDKLEVIELAIAEIAPFQQNPREHPEKQISMLMKSIQKSGFNNPVLVGRIETASDRHDLIAGHGRIEAAKRLGMTSVPAIVLGHLDANERRAYRVADNAIMLKGEWSIELLRQELSFQLDWDVEFDAGAIGFETGEVDAIVHADLDDEGPIQEPVADPKRNQKPISQLGTLWKVGPHRIICGDALDPKVWKQLMGERKADVTISDMPYNVPIHGHVSGSGRHAEFATASGEMSEIEFASFIEGSFRLQAEFSRAGSLSYQFIDWRSVEAMIRIGRVAFGKLMNLCVWIKPAAGMGSLFRSQHELVCVFRKGDTPHTNNVELGKHGRFRTNVWKYDGCTGFSADRSENLAMHPTVKNTQMIADAIMDTTKHGDLVVDGFLGSGTTALAAEQTGRACFGIEIEPLYVDLSVRRLMAVSGHQAIDENGRNFTELDELKA